jgi:hypothetical protein
MLVQELSKSIDAPLDERWVRSRHAREATEARLCAPMFSVGGATRTRETQRESW